MPSLPVHYFAPYLSGEENGLKFRPFDYDAMKVVHCLKGKPIKGYVTIRVGDKVQSFTEAETPQLLEILARTLAVRINSLSLERVQIVPVPNSSAIGNISTYRLLNFAHKVAARVPASVLVDAFRWRGASTASHKGGTRNSLVLRANLALIQKPGPDPILLLDDVLTTGGHMAACYMMLKGVGRVPICGVTLARVHWEYSEPRFGWRVEELAMPP